MKAANSLQLCEINLMSLIHLKIVLVVENLLYSFLCKSLTSIATLFSNHNYYVSYLILLQAHYLHIFSLQETISISKQQTVRLFRNVLYTQKNITQLPLRLVSRLCLGNIKWWWTEFLSNVSKQLIKTSGATHQIASTNHLRS